MTSESNEWKGAPLGTTLRRFLHDFASFAGRGGIIAVILVGSGAVLEALSLAVIVPLLSIAIGSDVSSGRMGRTVTAAFSIFGVEHPAGRLALLLGVFGLLIIVRAFILLLRDVRVAELQAGFVEAQRLRIAEYLVAAQWDQIVRLQHARVTHLMSGEIQRIGDMTQLLLRSAVLSAMLLAQFVLVLILAPLFASFALIFLIIGILVFLPFVRRAHALGGLMTNANLSLLDSTAQFLGGLKLAMSQNLQNRFIGEFRQSLHELTFRQIDYSRQQSRVRNALSILSALAAAVLVLIGFTAFHLATATLIALVVIIARMITPLGQIQQDVQQIVHYLPAYDKAKELEWEFASIPQQKQERASELSLLEGAITFEKVSYRYVTDDDDGESARGIHEVSLKIQPGGFIGITGPSGAGKTTFADLLVGLFPAQKGVISVGATVLEGAVLASWRDRVGYVSQDPFLFHDTVRRNIVWANPQASEKEIWDALTLVGADELIRGMRLGLDTVVGERGSLVSGGERQRIALVRGILRKPRLLVLDEATSAIDGASEKTILQNLRQIPNRPIVVIIAHRAESLTLCEHVFRFEAGRCVNEVMSAGKARSNVI
jgi:ATP-binding cassette, subfamily C, bacterial